MPFLRHPNLLHCSPKLTFSLDRIQGVRSISYRTALAANAAFIVDPLDMVDPSLKSSTPKLHTKRPNFPEGFYPLWVRSGHSVNRTIYTKMLIGQSSKRSEAHTRQ